MIVYRGPDTKGFHDLSHELVDKIDLAKELHAWESKVRLRANITKAPRYLDFEQEPQRRSVTHISFDAKDVLSLQRKLMKTLLDRSRELDALKRRLERLRKLLCNARDLVAHAETSQETTLLKRSKKEIEKALALIPDR